jgi:hypothetical protein
MDASPLNALVLGLISTAVGFYALCFVIRAGVRDGIRQARGTEEACTDD